MSRSSRASLSSPIDPMDSSLKPIEVNGRMYLPGPSSKKLREDRSKVLKYNDEDLRRMPEFKYDRLQSMHRRIRLLRLFGGGLGNPEITCELFEVEYDKRNIVRKVDEDPPARNHAKWAKARDTVTVNQTNGVNGSQAQKASVNGKVAVEVNAEKGGDEKEDDEEEISYHNAVEYEALSWCWGTGSKDCGIRINKGRKQHRLAATRELVLALKYLRHPTMDRILWIDALCIDQQNHEERNHQVQMMSRIYNCAKQVCVWLGEDNDDSAMAIRFVREIMKLENFDSISEKKENASKWQSLLLLMQRPWFSRRWVLQEIALARSATVYCGIDTIAWEHFAVAVELFVEVETATHRLSEVMQKDEAFGHVPQWFEHVSELGASVLVQATGKVFRQDGTQSISPERKKLEATLAEEPEGAKKRISKGRQIKKSSKGGKKLAEPTKPIQPYTPRRPLLSLEYLVSSLSVFEATQPRDAVYSLLAIARDTSPFAQLSPASINGHDEAIIMSTVSSFLERKPFKVDYSRPYSDVCKDFVSFCIQGARASEPTGALDILCRPWAPEPAGSSSGAGVVHKKQVPYKFQKKRDALWINNGRSRQQNDKRDAGMEDPRLRKLPKVPDSRTTNEYWNDQGEIDEDRKDKLDEFLPKKLKPPKKEDSDDEDSTVDDETESEDDDEEESEETETIDSELPSWVSRISGAPFALFHHPGIHSMLRMGRKNADPLVGLSQDGHRNYSAAQNTKVDHETRKRLRFRRRPVLGHYSLYVKGFILDEVVTVAEPARLGSIPETWPEMADWTDAVDGETNPPSEFWRTLVADRGKDNRNPPYYYATACKESVKKGGLRGGSVDTSALINSERNSIIAEFCRRVQAVIWNRCLIKTKKGTLGLARQHVKPGDLVCIIFGCTVPVILRKGRQKALEELKKEQFEDRMEAMKMAVSICEEACFRKQRYRRKLEELGQESKWKADLWKQVVVEELDAVNDQIREWKDDEKAAEERRENEDEKKEERKKKAARRQEARKAGTEKLHELAQHAEPDPKSTLLRRSTIQTILPHPGSWKVERSKNSLATHEEDPEEQHGESLSDDEPSIDQPPLAVGGSLSIQTTVAQPLDLGPTKPPEKAKAKDEDRAGKKHQVLLEDLPDSDDDSSQEKKEKKKKTPEELEDIYSYYTFMGEAYVHGMMDGEAVRQHILDKVNIPERLFEIR